MAEQESISMEVTKRSLLFWAFRGNLRLQLLLLALIAVLVVARVVPLEMQKRIVNEAIFLRRFDDLLLYCGIYLLAVTITGGTKLWINFLQATIGERALLAMRRTLYRHILSLPLHFFRSTQPGMVVSSLMTELASAGSFAGMALAVPVANVLTLLAFAGYLLWLNPQLGLLTLAIYPLVVFLIPYLQKKANRLNKQRVDQSRQVAGQITESITGINEINVHGGYFAEQGKFNRLVERLRSIRLRWMLFRFSIKTVNNYFVSLGPFVVFIFGGYLVMNGRLELGSMVAFLSAQEKLYDPWKELIEYYQSYQDASIRYRRTMQTFDRRPEVPLDDWQQAPLAIKGRLILRDVGYRTAEGKELLRRVSFSLEPGQHLALVGFSGSGKSTLVQCVAKMFAYTSGSIQLDGREVKALSKAEIIQQLGYISQNPFIFSGSIRENLLYAQRAARHAVAGTPQGEEDPSLDQLILSLQQAGFFVDVVRFGLETRLELSTEAIRARVVAIRNRFRANFGERLAEYIEFYDHQACLHHASILENIIFATSTDPAFATTRLPEDPRFRAFLVAHGLVAPLLHLGLILAKGSVEYHLAKAGKPDGEPSVAPGESTGHEPPTPMKAQELVAYTALLHRLDEAGLDQLAAEDRDCLLRLALAYTPAIHTVCAMPAELEGHILIWRDAWKVWSRRKLPGVFTYLRRDAPIFDQSVLNNILFGRIKSGPRAPQEKISQAIIHLLIEEDCLEDVAAAGMEYPVGNMGDKLSGGQRQKLAIARVLLKEPVLILMDEATSALDNASQTRIQRLIQERWKGRRTVISVVHRLDTIRGYDAIGVLKGGELMEYGGYEELLERKGGLHELVGGHR